MDDEENSRSAVVGTSEVELQVTVAAPDAAASIEIPGTAERTPSLSVASTNPFPDNAASNNDARDRLTTEEDTNDDHSHEQRTISDLTLADASTTVPSPRRRRTRLVRICVRWYRRLVSSVQFFFVLIISLASIIILVTFCVVPSLVCMTIGFCVYYSCTDTPESLPSMLRAMFRGEEMDNQHPNHWFGEEGVNYVVNASDRARANRELLQSRLIVRRLLRVEDLSCSSTKKDDGVIDGGSDEDVQDRLQAEPKSKTVAKEGGTNHGGLFHAHYSRRHPFPFHITTERKSFHFSEPLKANVKRDSDVKKNESADTEQETGSGVDLEIGVHAYRTQSSDDGDNDFDSLYINNLQRAAENQIGSRSLRQTIPSTHTETQLERDENESNRRETSTSGTSTIETVNISGTRSNMSSNRDTAESVNSNNIKDKDDNYPSTEKISIGHGPEESGYYCGLDEDVRDRGTMCDICLLEFEVGDEVAWSPNLSCSHTFHEDCILDWLMRKKSCPSCRQDYLKGAEDENV